MKIFAKGTQKYATEALFVDSSKLYFDAAFTNEVKQADVKKLLAAPTKIVINNGTSLLTITSAKLDGSEIVVGSTTYDIAE